VGAVGRKNVIDGTAVVGAVNQTVNLAAGTFSSTVVVPTGGFAAGTSFGFQIANFVDVLGTNNNDTVTGSSAANLITGAGGDDVIFGSAGNDSLRGGAGFDVVDYSGLGAAVTLKSGGVVTKGALGTDTLGTFDVAAGAIETFERVVGALGEKNVIDGTSVVGAVNQNVNLAAGTFSSTVVVPTGGFAAGTTFGFQIANFVDVLGTNNNDTVVGSTGANLITGAGGNDSLAGGGGADTVTGGAGNDTLRGDGGNDSLDGGDGADRLTGGTGQDTLRGGSGSDVFDFNSVAESSVSAPDIIVGTFSSPGAGAGDRIDVGDIDANIVLGGVQDFVFGVATGIGRLWAINEAGTNNTLILGNIDNVAGAEFAIRIEDGAGVLASAYTAADFIV
jgi:Ca2+-binding RTX toxin-like protein